MLHTGQLRIVNMSLKYLDQIAINLPENREAVITHNLPSDPPQMPPKSNFKKKSGEGPPPPPTYLPLLPLPLRGSGRVASLLIQSSSLFKFGHPVQISWLSPCVE